MSFVSYGERVYSIGPAGGLPGSFGNETLVGGEQSGGAYALVRYTCTDQIYRHVHEQDDESVYVISGTPTVTVGDTEHPLTPHSFLFMPRGVPHSIACDQPWVGLSVSAPGGVYDKLMESVGVAYAEAEAEGVDEAELGRRVGECMARAGIRVLDGRWVGELPITQ